MKRKIIGAMAALSIGAALFAGEKTVDFARENDPSAWDRNVPGKLNIAYDSEARGMKFTPVFRDEVKDFWVYPGIPLNLPAESMKNAVELRFEVKAVPAENVKFMLVIPVFVNAEGKRKSVHLNVDAPTEQWEERSVSLLRGDLNPEQIRTLRIGLNAKDRNITYWIRNVRSFTRINRRCKRKRLRMLPFFFAVLRIRQSVISF